MIVENWNPPGWQDQDEAASPASRSHILIVDDDRANRRVLREMLQRIGYTVSEAHDGVDAVTLYQERLFDMVLMDIMMPVMDGYQAALHIKDHSRKHNRFTPILFLTAATDTESLSKSVHYGGDDFLTKPFNHVLLKAKLHALERTKTLYDLSMRQQEELRQHHERLSAEHEIAEYTFRKLMDHSGGNMANVRSMSSSLGVTCGDVILMETSSHGLQYFLVGDFTGHGLAAAMGAIPASDVFHAMARKGLPLDELAGELNGKLKQKLPEQLFLSAALLRLDPADGSLQCCNAGLPDIPVWRDGEGLRKSMASANLPFGILAPDAFLPAVEQTRLEAGDHVIVYTDGVTETENRQGSRFGDERLMKVFRSSRFEKGPLDALWESLHAFRDGHDQRDDVTAMELVYPGSTGG